jgi:hypothetical protein
MRKKLSCYGARALLALSLWGALASVNIVSAQSQDPATTKAEDRQREQINHEVQLYLLVGSDAPGERNNVPQALDGAVRQLKESLPFSSYRLATTFFMRVRDGGSLELSGVGGFPLAQTPPNSSTPAFIQVSLSRVLLARGAVDQPFIQVERFRFGLKVPVQTGFAHGESGAANAPIIQYQDTGISTELSVREGVPTVVGTLAASQPHEAYVLVLTVKRTTPR